MRVLITGGNSWIAQAVATDRIARGDEVCLTASSEATRATLRATCAERGITPCCTVFDLRNPGAVSPELADWLATTDGLVLNAATPVRTLDRFHALPPGEVDAAIDADIKGNLALLRAALPGMADRRFGRIVFVSSVSVEMGTARYGAYCLTKAALEGLVRTLAVEYGGSNVLSNTLRLGIFRTARTEAFWRREKYRKGVSAIVPQGSIGDPETVPEALHPLLSPRQYINGSTVTVSGGLPLVNILSLPRQAEP